MPVRPGDGGRGPHGGPSAPCLPHSLLVKPAGAACNMRCRYCFYQPEKRGLGKGCAGGVMSEAVLARLCAELGRLPAGRLAVCWQGGEPTLAGLAFYRRAAELLRGMRESAPVPKTVSCSLQTNGLLLDAEWADFLAGENFLVGLSLDGPQELHDASRATRAGAGTWQKVMDSAHRLQDAGCQVNALCCLTAESAPAIEDIYAFFRDEGFEHMQFIPILEEDRSGERPVMAGFSLTAEAYGDLLCRLWDVWLADFERGRAPGIRYFESFCHRAFGLAPTLCEMYPVCSDYAVVERDGSVYPCDFFVTENWKLGNLEDGLPEVLSSDLAAHFREIRLMLAPGCRSCEWRPFCHGGCLKFRRAGGRLLPKTYYCEAYKMFFAHARADLMRVSARLMRAPARPADCGRGACCC